MQYGEDWHKLDLLVDSIEKLSNALCTELSIQGPIKIQYFDPDDKEYFVLRSLNDLPEKTELKILQGEGKKMLLFNKSESLF